MKISDLTTLKSFEEAYNTKLEDICLSSSVSDALNSCEDLKTVADLAKKRKSELLHDYEGIGAESILELEQVLLDFGLNFGIR